jgi:glycosyltransferase involved in cell wall biosynthesis
MLLCKLPVVTCVTVTRGRAACVARALRCYAAQTYPCRNMVVVSQGTPEENAAVRAVLDRADVTFYEARPAASLGELRNVSVELATGDLICQWDDDDLYHPRRIASQYDTLRADSRHAASLYTNFVKLFEPTGELYWCDWAGERDVVRRHLCGSVMFPRRLYGEFPLLYPQAGRQSCREEDLNALYKLTAKGTLGSVTSGWEYVYVYHGANTYDLPHHRLTLDTTSGKAVRDVTGCRQVAATFDTAGVLCPAQLKDSHEVSG